MRFVSIRKVLGFLSFSFFMKTNNRPESAGFAIGSPKVYPCKVVVFDEKGKRPDHAFGSSPPTITL
jgi:hypothetical protein